MKRFCMDCRIFLLMALFFSPSLDFAYAEGKSLENLTVGVPKDRCPIFYEDRDSGEITGIGIDLMRIAAENAGYNAVFKFVDGSIKDALDSSEYDVVMPLGSAISSSLGKPSVVSENLFQTRFTPVTVGNVKLKPFSELRLGMLKSLAGGADTVRKLYPGVEIESYETMAECVKALRKGKVDALLHNSYVWSYVLQKPSYSDLTVQPFSMFTMDFRVGASDTPSGRNLISRLDGGIKNVTDFQRQSIALKYTSQRLYKYDVYDYLYSYGLFILLGVIIAVVVMIFVRRQLHVFRLEHEKKIRFMKKYDELTGALSFIGFREMVTSIINRHPEKKYFIAFSNISDFKYLNERFGIDAGNDLLKFWAKKSMEILSTDDAVGRIGADHFAFFLHVEDGKEGENGKNPFESVEKISGAVSNFFAGQDDDVTVKTTFGVYALTSEDFKNVNIDKILDCARLAERQVRDNSKEGIGVYNSEQWENEKFAMELINHFPVAIQSGEIYVWLQPQVDFSTGKIIGAEALCRWRFQNDKWIPSGKFIPILENSGLIFDLDRHVWEEVCKILHRWNELGKRRSLSVNLSCADFAGEPDIPGLFRKFIQTYQLTPDQIHIEITESAYVKNSEFLVSTTEKLRKYGFKVEMDDFGSGYSSLNMLKEVFVDRLKLDLRFLTEKGDLMKGRIIIKHIIKMAHSLGMDLIAEGVEYNEQAAFLSALGCTDMQGFYFYKPMPVDEFEKLIASE